MKYIILVVFFVFASLSIVQADEVEDLQDALNNSSVRRIELEAQIRLLNVQFLSETEIYINSKKALQDELNKSLKSIRDIQSQLKKLQAKPE